jgi:hypothetical protein
MKARIFLYSLLLGAVFAQGPPITGDKPVMIGAERLVLKTLTTLKVTDVGHTVQMPLMAHYLPTANTLIGIYLPLHFNDDKKGPTEPVLGNIQVVGKYQFLRRDKTGSTLRFAAKTIQSLPAGDKADPFAMNSGYFGSYLGMVGGYESIRYGITGEFGVNIVADQPHDAMHLNIGFGLPLLKPRFPLRQINLYFEYGNKIFIERDWRSHVYSQGIQLAWDKYTFDIAARLPLFESTDYPGRINVQYFSGIRMIL